MLGLGFQPLLGKMLEIGKDGRPVGGKGFRETDELLSGASRQRALDESTEVGPTVGNGSRELPEMMQQRVGFLQLARRRTKHDVIPTSIQTCGPQGDLRQLKLGVLEDPTLEWDRATVDFEIKLEVLAALNHFEPLCCPASFWCMEQISNSPLP